MKNKNFEEALKELDTIVEKLESQETDLENAVSLFEKATELAKFCSKKLNEAQKKVQILIKDKNGDMKLDDFKE